MVAAVHGEPAWSLWPVRRGRQDGHTLQVMAEAFSRAGVPVFPADVEGGLSGISQPGKDNPKIAERIKALNLEDFNSEGAPVTFWDVFGEQGHPVRATVNEVGPPLLFSRLLNLNDT